MNSLAEKSKTSSVALGKVTLVNPESIGKGYPFDEITYIDISSVGSGTLSGTTRYQLMEAPSRARRLVENGDTILSTVRPNLRSFLFIKKPPADLVVSTGFAVLRPTDAIDPRFLYYSVTNQSFTDYLTANVKGAAYPAVDTEAFERATIRLPPLPIQRKIAAILSAYDDLIENNTRRIKILEQMAQLIYREWFVNFRFPGSENVKMVESELGMIPEGWEVKSYTDIIDVLSGGTPRTSMPEYWDGDIPWFTPRDLGDSWYVLQTERQITGLGLSKCNSKLYPEGTVFITARGTVGRCVLAGVPMAMSQTSYALKGHVGVPQSFVFLLTLSLVEGFKKQATGAVFDTIVVDTFRKQRVRKPADSMLVSFADSVNPILGLIKSLQLKNANLRQTRDLLLPKLISGDVDVEKLDIDTGGLNHA